MERNWEGVGGGGSKHFILLLVPKVSLTRPHIFTARHVAGRRAGCAKLLRLINGHLQKTTFSAWLADYKEVRRTRQWFSHVRGGEGGEAGSQEWYWPEGEDPVSSLPREVAVKVCKLKRRILDNDVHVYKAANGIYVIIKFHVGCIYIIYIT